MKIFITGAAGFIGSHFSERVLKNGHEVIGIDNFNTFYEPEIKRGNIRAVEETAQTVKQSFAFYEGDICNRELIKKIYHDHQPDVLVHLAAMAGVRPSMQNPLLYIEVNQLGTTTLLEEAKECGLKNIVFASSSSVYGNDEPPFSEEQRVDHPISHYAATKKAGELTCYTYHKIYDMTVACLRFFTVYGPRQRPDLAIHKFTKLMFQNQTIPIFGDGSKSRDFTYIDDTVDGVDKAMQWVCQSDEAKYEIFNLGESQTASVNELIEQIEKATGIKAKRDYQENVPGDVEITYADITKAKEVLGYDPKTKLEEGIPKFVEWYQKTYQR